MLSLHGYLSTVIAFGIAFGFLYLVLASWPLQVTSAELVSRNRRIALAIVGIIFVLGLFGHAF
jgi:hypothetical protein